MQPPTKIELLLSDVDGTLVTKEKKLTERARRAVLALKSRGVRFAITSGRPPRGMAMMIDPLEITTPIGGFNGGAYVRPDMTVIESRIIDPAAARRAVDLLSKAGLDAWVYTADEWLVRDPNAPHVAHETQTVQFGPKIVEDFGSALDQASKIVGVTDDRERMHRAEAEAQRQLEQVAAATRSQDYYLDITNPEANKGAVLDFLSRYLGIDHSAIMTIGDMPNDVLMFRKSGFAVAMGQAAAEVKAHANALTESYEEEGFAKAVERFLLGEDDSFERRASG
jgi:Cof subfamily protein (haloacid dehalogenase superfamily)